MDVKTADLCDDYSDQLRTASPGLKSYGKKKSFHGPISTVQVKDDNVLVKKALETIPAGNVLVVDGMGSQNCALMGGNLAAVAEKRKLAGIIIHGYIRDSLEVAGTDVGVLALGTFPLKSKKEGKGEEGIPLTFGNVVWHPGDYVYVDEDGVVLAEGKLHD
ncbi:ribonuclease E activity regulator RraA [Halobacillus litoralis]|uniref:4-hydroxy-4-methyl-2-oxoglutarate aldolase n=1 Tax=Halobacillus litoralis TaxID=45668 RepID=A0A845DMT9_9BACI|nr:MULTISPECIES: ribonuclease E activity regulator RraA [Halobacillus]MCA1023777.1 ribonuclease E activity regulator RraA [Halobacillus litoralis]MYL18673.1 ribonuclease E activity regulator RraA [Halobacillus litoralis]MYL31581.1 ribonuclease E activity regulator RraA [Halobacillus halophilus]MYL39111.1 ribonuclease E activity regulator RraA [Halobacillus litoralis]